jgi:hypothetical protein
MNPLENTSSPETPQVTGDTNTPPSEPDWWTTLDVAKHLRVSPKTVYNLRKKGLPYIQLGGAVRFIPEEIKNYLVTNRGLNSHRLRQIVRKGATPCIP